MRKLFGLLVSFSVLVPHISAAADMGIDATTLFRFEQRSVPGFSKETLVPATQFLTVDLGKAADGNLSFHLSGWGRVDLADRSASDDSIDGDLSYGYLMYAFPRSNAVVKAGRISVYDVGTVEQLDGVTARVDLVRGLSVSGFAGKPVRQEEVSDNRGNFIGGGRIGYRYKGKADAGVSFLHEDGAWSREYLSSSNLRTVEKYRQLLNGDLWLSPTPLIEFRGRTAYDTVVREVSDQTYSITVRPHRAWTVTGEYSEQKLQAMFSPANYGLTMFRPMDGAKVSSFGGSVAYSVSKPLELTADYRQTQYRRSGYGDSRKFGFGARMLMLERVRLGAAYHRLDADGDIPSYDEFRVYGMYTYRSFFTSLDLIAHKFSRDIYGKDTAFEATLSAGCRVSPEVAVAGDVSYGTNPQMKSDTRGVFKLNYNYETKGAR